MNRQSCRVTCSSAGFICRRQIVDWSRMSNRTMSSIRLDDKNETVQKRYCGELETPFAAISYTESLFSPLCSVLLWPVGRCKKRELCLPPLCRVLTIFSGSSGLKYEESRWWRLKQACTTAVIPGHQVTSRYDTAVVIESHSGTNASRTLHKLLLVCCTRSLDYR